MEDVLLWLSRILQGDEEIRKTKILNLSPLVAFPPGRIDRYTEARDLLLQRLDVIRSRDCIKTELNITPAMSEVPIHHDEDLVVSTVRTIASNARPSVEGAPAKIWIVWPYRHLHSLSQCSPRTSYGDTAHSLGNADGAVWFVQRDGETVVLPGNLAHSTFTIQSCYLLASSCPGASLARIPLISSDVAAGTTESYAVTRLVDTIEAALERPFDEARLLMHSFWSESAYNIQSLRRDKTNYSRFVELLINHMHRERRCVSCVVLGIVSTYKEISDHRRHIQLHTRNSVTATDKGHVARRLRLVRRPGRKPADKLKILSE